MVLLRDEIGSALRERRRDAGLTLRELGLRAAVSSGYISEIERGAKEPSSETLAAICGALDVPLSALLVDTAERAAVSEVAEALEAARLTVGAA